MEAFKGFTEVKIGDKLTPKTNDIRHIRHPIKRKRVLGQDSIFLILFDTIKIKKGNPMEEIKKEYEMKETSFIKLGEKYNINYKKIQRTAKKENWVKFSNVEPIEKIATDDAEDEEIKRELNYSIRTISDRVTIDMYLNSRKMINAIQKKINFDDFSKNSTILIKQLQAENLNLMRLDKKIKSIESMARYLV